MSRRTRVFAVVGARTFAFAFAGCSDDGGKKVNVELSEYTVLPNPISIKAGKIKFTGENKGGATHEMVVVKADNADALPTDADGAVDEEQLAEGQAQGEVEDVAKGTSKSVELDLTPARYVVFCNIVEDVDGTKVSHFKKGMYAVITVT
jgi:uncharacterized cupredoxin-like copper-binding protein